MKHDATTGVTAHALGACRWTRVNALPLSSLLTGILYLCLLFSTFLFFFFLTQVILLTAPNSANHGYLRAFRGLLTRMRSDLCRCGYSCDYYYDQTTSTRISL